MNRHLFILPVLVLSSCDSLKTALDAESESSSEATDPAGGSQTVHLQEGEIEAFRRRPDQVVILDFYADWCGPCRSLSPKLDAIGREFGSKVVLGKVNVDQATGAAATFRVSGIPDVRIYVGGREVDRFVGDIPEAQIREKIAPHAAKVSGRAAASDESADDSSTDQPVIQPMSKDWMPPGIERK